MGRVSELKSHSEINHIERSIEKTRLNLNDLLERRKKQNKLDRKTNLLIVSAVTVLATLVVVVISL